MTHYTKIIHLKNFPHMKLEQALVWAPRRSRGPDPLLVLEHPDPGLPPEVPGSRLAQVSPPRSPHKLDPMTRVVTHGVQKLVWLDELLHGCHFPARYPTVKVSAGIDVYLQQYFSIIWFTFPFIRNSLKLGDLELTTSHLSEGPGPSDFKQNCVQETKMVHFLRTIEIEVTWSFWKILYNMKT